MRRSKDEFAIIGNREIRSLCDQIVAKFQPQKIILFGSYAYGNPKPDSDIDLLIIVPFVGKNPEKATEIWSATKPDFAVDLIVRKPDEIQKRIKMGDPFIREIITKGVMLYEAHNS
jgi:predicted nucleotidyltransferase